MSRTSLNKSERQHILLGLVVDATKKTATAIVNKLTQLHKETGVALLKNWQSKVPELSTLRIADLLHSHALQAASLTGTSVYLDAARKSSRSLYRHSQERQRMSEARRDLQSLLYRRCYISWPGKLLQAEFRTYHRELYLTLSFPDVPAGFTGGSVVHPNDANPSMEAHLNNYLHNTHHSVHNLLQGLYELLDSAWDMYETLEAQLQPVKSLDVLLKLMPEASKHLPESLRAEKPTKELADPTAINEIREKLKKGLPV